MEDKKEKIRQQHIENKENEEKKINDNYLLLCIFIPIAFFIIIFLLLYKMGIFDYIENDTAIKPENKNKYKIIGFVGCVAIYVIGTYFIVDALIKERDREIAIIKIKIADLKEIATI
jgi:hypothetical protein